MKGGSASFGTQAIPQLLIKQAVPASIGILVMSLNILIDTIFVGQWIGANAIAAINVVLPVSFLLLHWVWPSVWAVVLSSPDP